MHHGTEQLLQRIEKNATKYIQCYRDSFKSFPNEAVNVADLSVAEVAYCEPLGDEPYVRVLIEEASPGAIAFHKYISDSLNEDFKGCIISVELSW